MIAFVILVTSLTRLYRQLLKEPEMRGLLLISAFLLLVGVAFYTRYQGWSVVDALYFCVVTLGTVGYGDKTPTDTASKLFTIGYIAVGLSVVGGFFAAAGRMISDNQRARHQRAEPVRVADYTPDDRKEPSTIEQPST